MKPPGFDSFRTSGPLQRCNHHGCILPCVAGYGGKVKTHVPNSCILCRSPLTRNQGEFTPKSTIESAALGQSLTLAGLHLPKTTASYRLTVFRLTANQVLYDHPSLYGCFNHRTESIFFEVNTSAQSPLRLGLDRIIRSFVSGRRVNHAGLRRSSIAITG